MKISKLQFRDRVFQINPNLKNIPRGYKRIENKIILRNNNILSEELGEAILVAYSWCTGVFQHLTTIGENRRPKLIHLAGDSNTIVTHNENYVKYYLDISKITFSGGNRTLRKRLVDEIKDGENLLDMFAAVGNLSIQVAVHRNINAILIEKDPYTYSFLKKTIEINKIQNTKIENIDCKDIEIENWADRIFMGYHNVTKTHIKAAIQACRLNTIIHLHPLAAKNNHTEWIDKYTSWINQFGVKVVSHSTRTIKNYSPNLDHIEVILTIQK